MAFTGYQNMRNGVVEAVGGGIERGGFHKEQVKPRANVSYGFDELVVRLQCTRDDFACA